MFGISPSADYVMFCHRDQLTQAKVQQGDGRHITVCDVCDCWKVEPDRSTLCLFRQVIVVIVKNVFSRLQSNYGPVFCLHRAKTNYSECKVHRIARDTTEGASYRVRTCSGTGVHCLVDFEFLLGEIR
jgi:hypothetical protein